jgi:OOP family OmpA-OmpF porin
MQRFAKAIAIMGGLLLASCFGHKLEGNAKGVGEVIKSARKNGAYRCAPKELALAEAHLRRTYDELSLGNYLPARRHLQVSEKKRHAGFQEVASGTVRAASRGRRHAQRPRRRRLLG